MMNQKLTYFIFFLLLLLAKPAIAQNEIKKEDMLQLTDTIGRNRIKALFIPLIFYTPETSFGFGVGGQLFFRTKGSTFASRLSNMFVSVFYTLNKQLVLDIKPQIYFKNEKYFLDAALKYKVYPDRFWGIGNNTPESNVETYSMKTVELKAAYLKRLPQQLNFGFEFSYQNFVMLKTEEGKLLETGEITGSDGAKLIGVNVIFNMDNRDNYFSPDSGHYVSFKAGFSSKALGSSHSFNKYIIDARRYIPLRKRLMLAIQGYLEFNFGDIPFQAAAIYGGGERARGYFKGRYNDGQMYVFQVEPRFKLSNRFKAAAFVSVGNVGNSVRDYFHDIKISFGGGIRYQILKDNKALVRLDIGVTKDFKTGIYFGVNEAF
jgi:surface antigen Omp85-like protein